VCGICGNVAQRRPADEREAIVSRMVKILGHRGPNQQGLVSDGIASLGAARLSIVDRAGGKQPFELGFHGNRGFLVYNGEIYNFSQLRSQLATQGIQFNTRCDGEAVLAAHLCWNLRAVDKFDGMFAYAFWHPESSRLLLVRDRLGIKPLFYADFGDELVFASEPKALFCHPRIAARIDPNSVLEYFLQGFAFASGYTTQDRSFYQGIRCLPPGHFLQWGPEGSIQTTYWSPLMHLGDDLVSHDEAQEELRSAVSCSVREMLMGEVPQGTALSGGLDSSIITSEAAQATNGQIVSACITYREDHSDPDAHHAELLSSYLNHERSLPHELLFTEISQYHYLDSLDELVCAFDEPHWEIRQLAMFENYRTLANAGRTVVLTGEGADELFFGYYWKFPGFRPVLSGPDDFVGNWRQRIPFVRALLAPAFRSGLISGDAPDMIIDSTVREYLVPYWRETGDQLRAVQCWYLHTFLRWLLMDNDRCSMAHSLEGRFPFLSQRLVSLALRMRPEWNIGSNNGVMPEKVLLRNAFRDSLPSAIWQHRAKSPLPVPLATSYHRLVADRLAEEVQKASARVWEFLDKNTVLRLLREFRTLVAQVRSQRDGGLLLTEYIPLGEQMAVRTTHLFAILTLIRWHELRIENRN
jgi:asparagine synthase (glutamine-hydrolysing)